MSSHQYTIPDGYKCCSKGANCKHPDGPVLPALPDFFTRNRSKKDGFNSSCRECTKIESATYYASNKAKASEKGKEYYQQNKERIKARVRDYGLQQRVNGTEVHRRKLLRQRKQYYSDLEATRTKKRLQARKSREKPERQEYERQYRKSPQRKETLRRYNNTPKRRAYMRQYEREWRARPDVKERNKRLRKEAREKNPERFRVRLANYRARKKELPNTFTAQDYNYAIEYFHGCCAVCGRQLNDLFGERVASMDHWISLFHPDCPGTIPTNMVPLCHQVGGCNNSKGAKDPLEWLTSKFGKRRAREINARIQEFFATVRHD